MEESMGMAESPDDIGLLKDWTSGKQNKTNKKVICSILRDVKIRVRNLANDSNILLAIETTDLLNEAIVKLESRKLK